MKSDTKDYVSKVLKAIALLAVISLWLYMAFQCWEHGGVSKELVKGTYLEKPLTRFGISSFRTDVITYIGLAGFPFLAFFMTVLIPDVLEEVFKKNPRVKAAYTAFCVPLLLTGFVSAWACCASTGWSRFSKGIFSLNKGMISKVLIRIDLNLTPVCLVLILLCWMIPRLIIDITSYRKNKKPTMNEVGKHLAYTLLLIALSLTVTAISAVLLSIVKVYMPKATSPIESMLKRSATEPMEFFCLIICAPLMEEVAFRGLIQNHMKKVSPPWAALLVASACFGIWHRNIGQMVYTFFTAIVWGIQYNASGKIRHTMLMHFVMNLTSGLAFADISLIGQKRFLPKLMPLINARKRLMDLPFGSAIAAFIVFVLLIVVLEEAGVRLIGDRPSKSVSKKKRKR